MPFPMIVEPCDGQLERVRLIQRQNHAAYLSHRRRILERLDGL